MVASGKWQVAGGAAKIDWPFAICHLQIMYTANPVGRPNSSNVKRWLTNKSLRLSFPTVFTE